VPDALLNALHARRRFRLPRRLLYLLQLHSFGGERGFRVFLRRQRFVACRRRHRHGSALGALRLLRRGGLRRPTRLQQYAHLGQLRFRLLGRLRHGLALLSRTLQLPHLVIGSELKAALEHRALPRETLQPLHHFGSHGTRGDSLHWRIPR